MEDDTAVILSCCYHYEAR
ncbi:MAG: hypothetical protein CME20_21140 [Gemmatimonadetes bacterium]|nr:hypothetical protein [Gemmatimonadota bacterium]